MSYRDDLRAEPFRFDFLALMRELERSSPKKPRIGDSSVMAEDVVSLGQDPFLEFPASNVTRYEDRPSGVPRVHTRFLGYFGPQGALPLSTTVEAYGWSLQRDESFARFTDIFATRFLQLFYRAWADARPIAQHERPAQDRFLVYLGSMEGIGSEPFMGRDTVEDVAKVAYAGMAGGAVKSAARLRQLIHGVFGVEVDIEERIGTWLVFEPGDRMRLGEEGSTVGVDACLGGRAYSINEKVRVCIRAGTLQQYRDFLPSGALAEKLADLVFFYLGHRFEFDVELALPARLATPVRLGSAGELGWTSWVSPPAPADGEEIWLRDTRYDPMERRRVAELHARQSRKARKGARAGDKA